MSCRVNSFWKRAFDLMCSTFAILVLFPFGLVIAAGIKISSKGPIFYKTERIGRNGVPFTLYKFRSMHVLAPADAMSDKEGTYFANTNRMFGFGKFLRASKLDELPQLLNIFRGQMSVVGPRPLPKIASQKHYSGENACVLDVRPGLTCLDSLFDYSHGELFESDIDKYRSEIVPIRDDLAKMYVEKQSLKMDIYCIFRTVQLMFEIVILKKKDFSYTKYENEAHQRTAKVHI